VTIQGETTVGTAEDSFFKNQILVDPAHQKHSWEALYAGTASTPFPLFSNLHYNTTLSSEDEQS
jgi:hypothetical protein